MSTTAVACFIVYKMLSFIYFSHSFIHPSVHSHNHPTFVEYLLSLGFALDASFGKAICNLIYSSQLPLETDIAHNLLSLYYSWRTWRSEMLITFSKVTQLLRKGVDWKRRSNWDLISVLWHPRLFMNVWEQSTSTRKESMGTNSGFLYKSSIRIECQDHTRFPDIIVS